MIYLLACFSFFLGSLPSGYWIVKSKTGKDLRTLGSHNTGATNVRRVLGKKYGFLVLVLDALKGMITLVICEFTLPRESLIEVQLICGSLSILGHVYSPFLSFRGGKGVATAFGVFLYMAFVPCLLAGVVFFVGYKLSGFVSVGSVLGAFSLPCVYFVLHREKITEYKFDELMVFSVMLVASLLIFVRHIPNIKRVIDGEELGADE